MAFDCFDTVREVTNFLDSERGARSVRQLVARGASAEEFISLFAEGCQDRAIAELIRFEFSELPRALVPTIVAAWAEARDAGKSFALKSRPPAEGSRMEFARNHRTSFSLDYDEAGITMFVSHMPRFHALWYRPQVAAAA